MDLDDRPVLVGVGTAVHRPADGPTPSVIDLMADAASDAAVDAGPGGAAVLDDVGWLGVPRGTWTHPDPGHALGSALGLSDAHMVLAEVGILQQTVVQGAIDAVAGGIPAALVVGGEAAHGSSESAAQSSGQRLQEHQSGPDERWRTDDYGLSHEELVGGFVDPPVVYAVIESALAHESGHSPAERRDHLGRLQARFASVAAANPDAWNRDAPGPEAIATATPENRMVATPYTKLCCSNLRVNQAGALLVTTVGRARRAGLDEDRWIFPRGGSESNLSVPVLHRPALHRSPGAEVAGARALTLVGLDIDSIDHLDLYSCFPSAVQVYARELGVDLDRDLTITGGMTFAGGPLNNYVLQSTAAMAHTLRREPGTTGLVTSVSGMLHKQAFAVWSSEAPADAPRYDDVTEDVRAADVRHPEVGEHHGPVSIVGHTVRHDREGPSEVVAVTQTEAGERLLAKSTDPGLLELFATEDRIGHTHRVDRTTLLA